MFPSARWKAYLRELMESEAKDGNSPKSIYHIYHSQKIWFTQDEKKNGHRESAEENLKKSDELLKDCTDKNNAREEILANTPKPSEALNWGSLTLQDLM
jgi:hypothetical protein